MEFKYRLDFYYQQALIYFSTLILYAGIMGTFVEDSFTLVFHDPILFIIAFFVLISIVTLILNRIRDRKLILTDSAIIFEHRFARRDVHISNIEWMHIGKERTVRTAGLSQVIVFKVQGRRRLIRIRIGRYERGKDLIEAMRRIADTVPRGERRRFPLRRKKAQR